VSETVFRQIGPYAIERVIGQGGMASVFLARDTRTDAVVALKVVHLGDDEEAKEILESEQRGAELQKEFSAFTRYVPAVYESGFATDYFYIAMEYIAGEDLSQAIHRGPLPWPRAVSITSQLCEFLEQADRFEGGAVSRRTLLHNDLKPRNIRLTHETTSNGHDVIKVLDFGAAKALSLSRKVTRNDFGSTAYLSPECLETGDRDRFSDAWALGVLLYEMVRGHQPYRAGDTRRLEQMIRARRPPSPMGDDCPVALQAVIAKLLAPYPQDRYESPADIRADLARVQAGEDSVAHEEGWPRNASDEPVTRRTRPESVRHDLADTEPVTRRTVVVDPSKAPTVEPVTPGSTAAAVAPSRPRRRLGRAVVLIVVFIFIALSLNEGCIASQANRLASTVPLKDFQGLADLWPQYQSLEGRSTLGGAGVSDLKAAFASHSLVLAERVMANYRTPTPTVREAQWKAAAEALRRAVTLVPGDETMRAALRYCEGHLLRINGEANRARKDLPQAQQQFADAVVAFREAAALRPGWPDPFLGLARTFIYGLDDVDRGADALAQAEKNGHSPSERETMQLADGYRIKAETLERTALTLRGMEQEREYLIRASAALLEALTRYQQIAAFANVAVTMRDTQRKRDLIEKRIAELSKPDGWWPWA